MSESINFSRLNARNSSILNNLRTRLSLFVTSNETVLDNIEGCLEDSKTMADDVVVLKQDLNDADIVLTELINVTTDNSEKSAILDRRFFQISSNIDLLILRKNSLKHVLK